VFGISRRRVATFEQPVKKVDGLFIAMTSLFHFGTMAAYMQMVWVKNVCGGNQCMGYKTTLL
jgi:hypothetical protein